MKTPCHTCERTITFWSDVSYDTDNQDDTVLALCDALDATRAYAKAAKDEHTKALARIAAALAERCEGPMCECCDMVLGALTGGTP